MTNTIYFASKYLKQAFEKKSPEIGSIKYVAGMKYFLKVTSATQR